VLNCIIAHLLYRQFIDRPEGELSRIRANLVNQESLYEIATGLELGRHLRLGEGELRSGGNRRPSILADATEALIGAVFLDGGFDAAATLISRLYRSALESPDKARAAKDAKTELQEWLQARRMATPTYGVVTISGEAHEQTFMVDCSLNELSLTFRGEGPSRRAAEQHAARLAISQLFSRND
jgi:ribonuclease III